MRREGKSCAFLPAVTDVAREVGQGVHSGTVNTADADLIVQVGAGGNAGGAYLSDDLTLGYPLAYHGWGDMLVLLFFGFVPVGCTYYVLCGGWTWQVAVVAAACGLVIDTLLMVNNYRDREQDARSGKRTLVVRLGERAGQRLYLLSGFAAAALCLGLWGDGRTWAALLPLLYLPPHVAAWRRMVRIGRGRELNAVLGATSRNILLFGLLLTLGLLL